MKIRSISDCEIEIIECCCGYHLGVDTTYVEQVNHFITHCPAYNLLIDTRILDEEENKLL